jgi:hypothetical protein
MAVKKSLENPQMLENEDLDHPSYYQVDLVEVILAEGRQ